MNFKGKAEDATVKEQAYDSIAKYMAKDVISFSADQPIVDAIDVMLDKRISGAPV